MSNLDPLQMLLDAAEFIKRDKPEWAKAARAAVAASRVPAPGRPDREFVACIIAEQLGENYDKLVDEHFNPGFCKEDFRRCADALSQQLATPSTAPTGRTLVDPDLVQRCKELLEWSATGLLNGGSGGSVRNLAAEWEPKVGDIQALNIAQSKTRDEAMAALVRIATAHSPSTATTDEPVAWNCIYPNRGHITLRREEAEQAARDGAQVRPLIYAASCPHCGANEAHDGSCGVW